MRRSRRTWESARRSRMCRAVATYPRSPTDDKPRRTDVTQPKTTDERSAKEVAPESGEERTERYAAAALNVVGEDSTAVSESDDTRGRTEEDE